MAWDWNKSGRVDSFEFEKVDSRNITKSYGRMECLVTGGTLSYSYYSDLKVSGTLEVASASSDLSETECMIRVWYCPTLDGEKKRIALGTFYYTADLHYENGTYKGRVNLRSALARHIDDLTAWRWTIKKDSYTANAFKQVFTSLGGRYKIKGAKNVKLKKAHIWDAGVSPMAILQWIADSCGGEIAVDPQGYTVLQPYKSPQNKAKSITHTITANKSSVILPGLDIANSLKEIPNRVVCVYEETNGKSKTQHVGKAALAASEKRSYQNIGRWITKYYRLNSCSKPYVTNLNKKAKTYLSSLNSKTIYYEFDTYYQPIELGEVIKLTYDNITVKGLVSNIDLTLGVGAKMHVKIRKV